MSMTPEQRLEETQERVDQTLQRCDRVLRRISAARASSDDALTIIWRISVTAAVAGMWLRELLQ